MLIGDVEIHLVSDGTMHMDAGGIYGLVPKVLWQQIEQPDELNRLPQALNCLLVRSRNKTILIDNGLGEKLTEKQERNFGRENGSQLLKNLAQFGVRPEDVDIVIDTHLHADHCGGNTRRQGEQVVPTFPRAEYYIQRLEWADAAYPNERTSGTYFAENFEPLGPSRRVCMLNGDYRVTEELRCIVTPGHTRAHQSVIIESKGSRAIFLADLAGRTSYLEKLAWIPAYDVEPLVSLETKRRIRDWAAEEQALLLFQHDPRIAAGRLKKDGDRWRVEPVEED